MSRQNKQAKKKMIAVQFTALHKQGNKGPAKTQVKHKKTQRQTRGVKPRTPRHEDQKEPFTVQL